MAFYKNPSAIRRSILAFVRHLVSKTLYREFELLLSPCCIPTISLSGASCTSTSGVYGVKWSTVNITTNLLSNQEVQIFLTAKEYPGAGAIKTITLDSNGNWTGSLQSSFEGAIFPGAYDLSLVLTVLPTNLSVVYRSVPVVVNVPNCD